MTDTDREATSDDQDTVDVFIVDSVPPAERDRLIEELSDSTRWAVLSLPSPRGSGRNITGSDAGCGTFIDISLSGGLPTATAKVGACHRTDCTHNDHLECHADSIRVGPGADAADCLTYEVA